MLFDILAFNFAMLQGYKKSTKVTFLHLANVVYYKDSTFYVVEFYNNKFNVS